MKNAYLIFIIFGLLISFSANAQDVKKKELKKASKAKPKPSKKASAKEMKSIDLKESFELKEEMEEAPMEMEGASGGAPEMTIPESEPLPVEAEPVPGAEIYLEQNPEEEVKPELKNNKAVKVKKNP
ncbi:MAG: hypothetical protein JXR58_05220 [Bacteroidales bacterium]|nr:hypothetical protein [Bacteroidales bacterium]